MYKTGTKWGNLDSPDRVCSNCCLRSLTSRFISFSCRVCSSYLRRSSWLRSVCRTDQAQILHKMHQLNLSSQTHYSFSGFSLMYNISCYWHTLILMPRVVPLGSSNKDYLLVEPAFWLVLVVFKDGTILFELVSILVQFLLQEQHFWSWLWDEICHLSQQALLFWKKPPHLMRIF